MRAGGKAVSAVSYAAKMGSIPMPATTAEVKK